MKIHVDAPPDEQAARALASALATHLDEPVELVVDGEELISAGDREAFDDPVITDREQQIRDEIEDILSGGPERGHEKI
jgi:hypothetical protein